MVPPQLRREQLEDVGEKYGLPGWLVTTDRRPGKLIDEVIALMAAIEADPQHELRGVLDDWLRTTSSTARARPAGGRRSWTSRPPATGCGP